MLVAADPCIIIKSESIQEVADLSKTQAALTAVMSWLKGCPPLLPGRPSAGTAALYSVCALMGKRA